MAEVSKIDIDGIEWDIRDDILAARFEQFLVQRELQRSYSTSEINTGEKWINGKPIYRMVVNSTTYPSNFSLSNVETVINQGGSITSISSNNTEPFPRFVGSGAFRFILNCNTNKVTAYSDIPNLSNNYKDYKLWIEYTKTTN